VRAFAQSAAGRENDVAKHRRRRSGKDSVIVTALWGMRLRPASTLTGGRFRQYHETLLASSGGGLLIGIVPRVNHLLLNLR